MRNGEPGVSGMLHGWSLSTGRCLPRSDADRGMRRRPSFVDSAVRPSGSSDQTVGTDGSAVCAAVSPSASGYRTPKSVVMIVTAPPPYSPVEVLACTAATPISRQVGDRMF